MENLMTEIACWLDQENTYHYRLSAVLWGTSKGELQPHPVAPFYDTLDM